jgi:hypothetical protein
VIPAFLRLLMNIMAKISKKRIYFSLLVTILVSVGVFSNGIKAQAYGFESADVIELVNKARIAEGLSALVHSDILDLAAKEKADDMLKNDYFAHTSPKGVDPWYWFKKTGYDYKYAGENLAINYDNAREQQAAWMKSDSHRKNILNDKYQETGVAVVEGKIDGQTSILTVQVFGTTVAGAAQAANNSSAGKEKPATAPAKKPEVLSAENPTAQIPNVLEAPAVVSAEKAILQQTSTVSNGLEKRFGVFELINLGVVVLLLVLISALVLMKIHRLHNARLSVKQEEGEESFVSAIENENEKEVQKINSNYLDFAKKIDLHLHKIKNKHMAEIRPG